LKTLLTQLLNAKVIGVFVVILSALSAFAIPYRYLLLTKVGQFLVVRDRPTKAGFIYVLGGDYFVRVPAAVKLYQEGWAPLIVIPWEHTDSVHQRSSQTEGSLQVLASLGVNRRSVIDFRYKDGVASTADEARALKQLAAQMPAARIILVTSSFHSRRVSMAMARALSSSSSAVVVPVDDPLFDETNWWRVPQGRHQVGLELTKLLYYAVTFWP
jgi:uncharacterized SAM-binding protein YcdF (DUF218 family)